MNDEVASESENVDLHSRTLELIHVESSVLAEGSGRYVVGGDPVCAAGPHWARSTVVRKREGADYLRQASL